MVIVYEASQFPIAEPRMDRMALWRLRRARLSGISTLFVPPLPQRPPDRAMVRRLGLEAAAKRGR